MTISKHGELRLRKRQGIKKNNIEKEYQKVLSEGLTHSQCKGKLKKYVDRLYFIHPNSKVRLYKNYVYVFSHTTEVLITVFPIPGNLLKVYQENRKKVGK